MLKNQEIFALILIRVKSSWNFRVVLMYVIMHFFLPPTTENLEGDLDSYVIQWTEVVGTGFHANVYSWNSQAAISSEFYRRVTWYFIYLGQLSWRPSASSKNNIYPGSKN